MESFHGGWFTSNCPSIKEHFRNIVFSYCHKYLYKIFFCIVKSKNTGGNCTNHFIFFTDFYFHGYQFRGSKNKKLPQSQINFPSVSLPSFICAVYSYLLI